MILPNEDFERSSNSPAKSSPKLFGDFKSLIEELAAGPFEVEIPITFENTEALSFAGDREVTVLTK